MLSAKPQYDTLNSIRRRLYKLEDELVRIRSDINRDIGFTNKHTFGNVPAGNYAEFSRTNGTLRFLGDGRDWEDYNFGAELRGNAASAPDYILFGGVGRTIQLLGFDGVATTEQMFGDIELPHDRANYTNIIPHIHWTATTADAGDVIWRFTYVLQYEGGALGAEVPISVTQAASGTAWQEQRADFPEIDCSAIGGPGWHLSFRLFRDPGGADTYAHDACLKNFGIHYIRDGLGSDTVDTK